MKQKQQKHWCFRGFWGKEKVEFVSYWGLEEYVGRLPNDLRITSEREITLAGYVVLAFESGVPILDDLFGLKKSCILPYSKVHFTQAGIES